MRYLFIVLIFYFPVIINAQQVTGSQPEYDWTVADIKPDYYFNYQLDAHSDGYNSYMLDAGANEKIIPLRVDKKGWGVARINSEGKIIWEYDNDKGSLCGIGNMGVDVIAIHATKKWGGGDIVATLIDGKTGAVKKENIITEVGNIETKIFVQNNPTGAFNDILLISMKKAPDPISYFLNADLSVSSKVSLTSAFEGHEFSGSIINNAGEIFLAYFTDDEFTINRYNKDGSVAKSLTTPIHRRSEYFAYQLQIQGDNTVIAGLNYSPAKKDNVLRLTRFDFEAGKAMAGEEILLERDFIEKADIQKIPGTREGNYRNVDQATIVGIQQWKDKIIVISEIRIDDKTPSGGAFKNYAWLATEFDKDLKPIHTAGIDKFNGGFILTGVSLGYHIYQDKLIVVGPALKNVANFVTFFSSLDLTTGHIDKAIVLSDIPHGSPIEGGSTIWFPKSFLIQKLSTRIMTEARRGTFYKVIF